mmetsp:Transcript_58334/g.126704  ORF Transcript_58334/g.126704 Transcript_58334/m.126704 type:complete len:219 (-) Transcript_58334:103-759(-)
MMARRPNRARYLALTRQSNCLSALGPHCHERAAAQPSKAIASNLSSMKRTAASTLWMTSPPAWYSTPSGPLLNFICFLPLAASWSTISTKGIPSSSAGFWTLSASWRRTHMVCAVKSSWLDAPWTKRPGSSWFTCQTLLLQASRMSSETLLGVKGSSSEPCLIGSSFRDFTKFHTIMRTCVLISPLERSSCMTPSIVSVRSRSPLLRWSGTIAWLQSV